MSKQKIEGQNNHIIQFSSQVSVFYCILMKLHFKLRPRGKKRVRRPIVMEWCGGNATTVQGMLRHWHLISNFSWHLTSTHLIMASSETRLFGEFLAAMSRLWKMINGNFWSKKLQTRVPYYRLSVLVPFVLVSHPDSFLEIKYCWSLREAFHWRKLH